MRLIYKGVLRLVAEELERRRAAGTDISARLLAFPKRIHELPPSEGVVPDGLSVDYVALAVRLNEGAAADDQDVEAGEELLRALEREVSLAVLHERQLISLMKHDHADSHRQA